MNLIQLDQMGMQKMCGFLTSSSLDVLKEWPISIKITPVSTGQDSTVVALFWDVSYFYFAFTFT